MGKQVTVRAGFQDVMLPATFTITNPDGSHTLILGTSTYKGGDTIVLTDDEYFGLPIATSRCLTAPITVNNPTRPSDKDPIFWQPDTPYVAGQQLIDPNNNIVSANANHTSGDTYNVSLYTGSATWATAAQLTALIDAAPSQLDTLNELATALGDDPNFSTTVLTAVVNRVRWDGAQGLTADQQNQAQANIGLVVDGF